MARAIRFLRDTDARREGGDGFKKGDVATLRDASARRWVLRNAAEYVAEKDVVTVDISTLPPDAVAGLAEAVALAQAQGDTSGNTVAGSEDVGSEDGGDSGERAQPDAGAGAPRRRGRPPGNSNQ